MTTETNDNRWVIVWLLFAALAVGLSSAPLLAQPADSGPGQALRVNGAGAHVAVPFDRAFAMGSGFFTIELWFRLDSLPTDAPAQFVSNDEYELGVDKPDLGLFTGGHGAGLRGFRQVRAGRWYHVAWIKGEAGMQLIVNGVLESPTGQTSTPSGRAETDLWIGSDPSQSTWAMHGLIDELRIWRRARSVDEIIADKNRSAPVNPDSLILHYSFDAIDPDGRIPDVSGNGHTGKLAEGAELTPSDAPIDLLDLSPVLAVSSTEIHLGPAPTVTFVSIDNAGGGVVSWSLSESAPWLRAASFFGDSEDGGLEGVGDEVLALYTSGRDLPAEEHEARVTILSDGGEQEIAVKLSPSPGYPTAHALASSAGQLLPLSFNSGMQVPALTPLAGLTRFTIEFWVKRFPGRGDGVVLVVADAVTQRLRLSHDGESWRWRVNRSARQKPPIAQAVVSAPLLPDTYHHVAIVQDGDTFRFYADGSLAHEQGNMRVRWHNADYRLVVGNGDAGGFFLGNLDELRIWDQALSRDQIARRINLSLRGDEEHLVAYWRFDELDASGRIPDLSGNGQHGIMPPRRTLAASTAPVAVEAIPALRVVPIRISANGDRVSRSNLAVANVGGGVLFWELQSDQPWLRLSRSARHLPLTRLSGEGAATVHTDGRGLPSGEYIGTVTGAGNGGSVVVSVVMRVRTEPELDDTEARVEPVDVPGDAWSTSYHLPPDQVLGRPLEPADLDLASRYPDQAFQDLRLVATTAAGVLYAAAEAPIPDGRGGTLLETRVWISRNSGETWDELLHSAPQSRCDYSVVLQSAALHPDGSRVFLGTSHGLFLDDVPMSMPPQAGSISAQHVSADGEYLYVVTQDLSTLCEWPTRVISVAGLYRARLGDQLEWEDLTSSLTLFLAPLAAMGSHPQDSDQVFLHSVSGALFAKTAMTAAAYGWQAVPVADQPDYLSFGSRLPRAEPLLRVPTSYPGGFLPRDLDIRWGWLGFLFGWDGRVYGHYGGTFSHSEQHAVIESRDGGVSWQRVWGDFGFGWSRADLEPVVFFGDARGFIAASGSSMTGHRAEKVGPWAVDPIDPLTAYVAMKGRGLVHRTRDGGDTWERVGQGLRPTMAVTGVAVDSVGVLYVRTSEGTYRRQMAEHRVRLTDLAVKPVLAAPGSSVLVTARHTPWPPWSSFDPGLDLQVAARLETETTWLRLRDDGLEPDRAAGDGTWSGVVTVPFDQPVGYYNVLVKAEMDPDSPQQASGRATFQVVPDEEIAVYVDTLGANWGYDGGDLLDTEHVHSGNASHRFEGETAYLYHAKALHPFGRWLDFWVYTDGPVALRINDLDLPDSSNALVEGEWAHITVRAERLHAHPNDEHAAERRPVALLSQPVQCRHGDPVSPGRAGVRAARALQYGGTGGAHAGVGRAPGRTSPGGVEWSGRRGTPPWPPVST